MLRKSLLILFVLSAAILIGCNKTEMSNSNTAADNSNKSMASTGSTASGDKVGIAECDDYIAKYEACTPKVPEPGRAAYKNALDQVRANWKKLAADPATRGSLAAACKTATDNQAAAWKMYGCGN
jgi:hypothetical protein